MAEEYRMVNEQAGTGLARPLKNRFSRHPLAFSGGICDNIRVPWG